MKSGNTTKNVRFITALRGITLIAAICLVFMMIPSQAWAQPSINKSEVSIYVGKSVTLKVRNTTKAVSWKSSKKSVATVSSKGKVSGVKAGKATITAKVAGQSFKCAVTVKKPTLNRTSLGMEEEDTYNLKAYGFTAKSYKSSNTAVAVVSKKGVVTAKAAGKATITCTSSDKKTYKCTVTVKSGLSEKSVYNRMIALKSMYPEGKRWTNENYYAWKGGVFSGGYGCAGFAFILSDAAFDKLPARKHYDVNAIRVGDVLRVHNDTHMVIVLEIRDECVIVAEGNYNYSIHWGRKLSKDSLATEVNYILTRYPK